MLQSFRAVVSVFCITLVIVVVFCPLVSADWSMFRANPCNTGVGTGNAILRPALLWNYSTEGQILSSPAVVGDVVYFGSDDSNVYALNADNGTKIWNCSTFNRVSYSTPAVADGYLYIASHNPLTVMNSTWSIQTPNSYNGSVSALNASNGEKYWDKTFSAYVSPPTALGDMVYITLTGSKLYVLSGTSGHIFWSRGAGGLFAFQAVADGVAFTGGINAYDATTGYYIWSASRNLYSFPVVGKGIVYGTNLLGEIVAFSIDNGNPLWNYSTPEQVWSLPALYNDVLYFGCTDGNVYALNATSGQRIWNHTIGLGVRSSPAVAGGIVYVTCSGNLYALNVTDGDTLWSYNMTTNYGQGQLSNPVVDNGTIYFAYGNSIYAFVDATTLPEPTSSPIGYLTNTDFLLVITASASIVIIAVLAFIVQRRHRRKNL
jgi:outer membrane protein assembly factor BamB